MKIRWAKNLKLRDVEVFWDQPASAKWKNALSVQDVKQLELSGFSARQAKLGSDEPAVIFAAWTTPLSATREPPKAPARFCG